jgi:hypothetical protein
MRLESERHAVRIGRLSEELSHVQRDCPHTLTREHVGYSECEICGAVIEEATSSA